MYGYVWLCKLKVKLGVFLVKFLRLGAVEDALVSLGSLVKFLLSMILKQFDLGGLGGMAGGLVLFCLCS